MGAGEFQDGAVLHLWVCGAWEGGGVRGAGTSAQEDGELRHFEEGVIGRLGLVFGEH